MSYDIVSRRGSMKIIEALREKVGENTVTKEEKKEAERILKLIEIINPTAYEVLTKAYEAYKKGEDKDDR